MGCGVSRGTVSPVKSPQTPEVTQEKDPMPTENANGEAPPQIAANGDEKSEHAENANDSNGAPETDGSPQTSQRGKSVSGGSPQTSQRGNRKMSSQSSTAEVPAVRKMSHESAVTEIPAVRKVSNASAEIPGRVSSITAFASMNVNINTKGGSNKQAGLFNIAASIAANRQEESRFAKLLEEHSRFLISFVTVLDHDAAALGLGDLGVENFGAKPKLEVRQFKSHTMDNVRVRKMCDELLHLEDTSHKMQEDKEKTGNRGWMRTLQVSVGNHVHSIKLANNPEVKIGGYFIISQMLSYIKGLISLDLSSNELTAAEARVLAIGLKLNSSLQELRMKENAIGSEGATSMADALKVNKTLLLVDLRMNSIRGPGICMLADSMSDNRTLTSLDLRWNYAGDAADFVETALLDLKKFCFRNMKAKLQELWREGKARKRAELDLKHDGHGANGNGDAGGGEEEVRSSKSDPDFHSQASTHSSLDRMRQAEAVRKPKEMVEVVERTESEELDEEDEEDDDDEGEEQPIGKVEVTIISAKNLPQVIWTTGKDGEFLGLPQAYCVCALGKSVFATKIHKKGWNPKWDFTCSMDVQTVWNVVTVRVMHSKSTTSKHRDDYTIGTVNLPIGSVVNWRGVSKGLDGTWRAFHKPATASRGEEYKCCKGKDRHGTLVDSFETAEAAAVAYDGQARAVEGDRAAFNMAGEGDMIGFHVKEEPFKLGGEDGVDVIGVQAGVNSAIKLRIKYFSCNMTYLELHLERASSLPKMDAGLGTCDAYANVIVGHYNFRSRVVKNSLDPHFNQWFRMGLEELKDEMECRVQIWDWDRFDEDDHMGDAVVKMPREKLMEVGGLDGSYGLIDSEGTDYVKNAKGERSCIHLKFEVYWAAEPIC